jgi:hypothetical protein
MEKQTENFTLRMSPLERRKLDELAKRLRWSQSKTIRVLVCETLKVLLHEETRSIPEVRVAPKP